MSRRRLYLSLAVCLSVLILVAVAWITVIGTKTPVAGTTRPTYYEELPMPAVDSILGTWHAVALTPKDVPKNELDFHIIVTNDAIVFCDLSDEHNAKGTIYQYTKKDKHTLTFPAQPGVKAYMVPKQPGPGFYLRIFKEDVLIKAFDLMP